MISKDATADMVVLVAVATDKDDDENGRVTYKILNGNTRGTRGEASKNHVHMGLS